MKRPSFEYIYIKKVSKMDESEFSDEYIVLKSIVDGEYQNDVEVGDNMVVKHYNKNNPGKTFIKLTFEEEEFLNLIEDLSQYDIDDAINLLNVGRYYYHEPREYLSWDSAEDEFKEGYHFGQFDVENTKILKEIIKYSPDVEGVDDHEGIARYFLGNDKEWNYDVSSIITEYQNRFNECMEEGLVETIKSELSDILNPYNIVEKELLTEYVTIASNLVKLYEENDLQNLTIKDLIEILITNLNQNFGGYSEDVWNVGCHNFDAETYNKDIHFYLNRILNKIEESFEDDDSDIEGYERIMGYIKKLPHVKHDGVNWYPLPTMEGYSFNINNVNVINGVKITLRKNSDDSFKETRTIRFDDFPTFIENYKLFENKKIKQIIREQLKSTVNNQVLNFIETLPPIKDKQPIDYLKDEIKRYNQTSGSNVDFESVLNAGLTKNPKFKIDLFGIQMGDTQKVIKTLSYNYKPNITFTLTLNPVWDKKLPGVNINF